MPKYKKLPWLISVILLLSGPMGLAANMPRLYLQPLPQVVTNLQLEDAAITILNAKERFGRNRTACYDCHFVSKPQAFRRSRLWRKSGQLTQEVIACIEDPKRLNGHYDDRLDKDIQTIVQFLQYKYRLKKARL